MALFNKNEKQNAPKRDQRAAMALDDNVMDMVAGGISSEEIANMSQEEFWRTFGEMSKNLDLSNFGTFNKLTFDGGKGWGSPNY